MNNESIESGERIEYRILSVDELAVIARTGMCSSDDVRRLVAEVVKLRMTLEMIEAMIDDGSSETIDLLDDESMDAAEKETIN